VNFVETGAADLPIMWSHCSTSLSVTKHSNNGINPLNAELNSIHHLLALVGARHFVHVSKIMVKMGGQARFKSYTLRFVKL
jgi:hypothetical protein